MTFTESPGSSMARSTSSALCAASGEGADASWADASPLAGRKEGGSAKAAGRSAGDKLAGLTSGLTTCGWLAADGPLLVCEALSAMVLCSAEGNVSCLSDLASVPTVDEARTGRGVAWEEVAVAVDGPADSVSSATCTRRLLAAGSTETALLFLTGLAAGAVATGGCLTPTVESFARRSAFWGDITGLRTLGSAGPAVVDSAGSASWRTLAVARSVVGFAVTAFAVTVSVGRNAWGSLVDF